MSNYQSPGPGPDDKFWTLLDGSVLDDQFPQFGSLPVLDECEPNPLGYPVDNSPYFSYLDRHRRLIDKQNRELHIARLFGRPTDAGNPKMNHQQQNQSFNAQHHYDGWGNNNNSNNHHQQHQQQQQNLHHPAPQQGQPHHVTQYNRMAAQNNTNNTANAGPPQATAFNIPSAVAAAADQQHRGTPGLGGNNNSAPGAQSGTGEQFNEDDRRTLDSVAQLLNDKTRETALLDLSKKREQVSELALVLWSTFGVMTCLLQEIISVYPLLNPSQLTAAASNRVCNALALLQCVASHPETRQSFLSAHIPLFLYPFLNTTSKSRPFEYLRLTSLGVIGALVKNDSSEVINFLLTTEIIPLCLRIMETGSELSKTVAIFIVQKILLDDVGLNYICQTYERFYAVGTVLSNMVSQLVEQQTVRLLKHVVRCFLRLSDNARAREALRQCLPEPLRDATFAAVLRDDAATKRCLAQLLVNLSDQVGETVNGPMH